MMWTDVRTVVLRRWKGKESAGIIVFHVPGFIIAILLIICKIDDRYSNIYIDLFNLEHGTYSCFMKTNIYHSYFLNY